jgi:hypothetical protein
MDYNKYSKGKKAKIDAFYRTLNPNIPAYQPVDINYIKNVLHFKKKRDFYDSYEPMRQDRILNDRKEKAKDAYQFRKAASPFVSMSKKIKCMRKFEE